MTKDQKYLTFMGVFILLVIILSLFFFGGGEDDNTSQGTGVVEFPGSQEGGNIPSTPGGSTERSVVATDPSTGEDSTGNLDFPVGTREGDKFIVRRISDTPVVGATTITKGDTTTVRYLERGTGHVYDIDTHNWKKRRVSNQTVPRIMDVIWGNLGQAAIARFLDPETNDVRMYSFSLPSVASSTETVTGQAKGEFIPGVFTMLDSAPRGEEAFICEEYLSTGMRKGQDNDSAEVILLQSFINNFEGGSLDKDGHFGTSTENAVFVFQEKYAKEILEPVGLSQASGIVGPSTIRKINSIYCEESGQIVTGGKYISFEEEPRGLIGNIRAFGDREVLKSIPIPLKDVSVSWVNRTKVVITTKASHRATGYSYVLDLTKDNPELEDLVNGVEGLLVLPSPDNMELVAYTRAGPGGVRSFFLDRSENLLEAMQVDTLVTDKCAWNKSGDRTLYCAVPDERLAGNLPDAWYKGLRSFEDSIFRVNPETGTLSLLASRFDFEGPIDAVDLLVTDDDRWLVLKDKTTSFLWIVRLKVD